MTAAELRQKYLDFFQSKGHTVIPSASLIPENDPSVLFTTAGMHPFKEFYLNPEKSENSRIATIQKCVRTIDIEEVGDKTHLTFFEMLGNFSFGYPDKQNSYFKEETINYAWEFLTENLEIDRKRIYATYFKGQDGIAEDAESLSILKKIRGLNKIIPQGFDENFWSLGIENSPGGPTVEFYVDGIEVWNCVFNEYVLREGKYEPADKKGVDTGMGLERLLAVLDGKETIFETELFWPIIQKIEQVSSKSYKLETKSYRIIADHLKAAAMIIGDKKGITPSNIGQGYVVRRLIRRAIRHGKILGIESNFIQPITEIVIEIYKNIYPEIEKNRARILAGMEKEESKFRGTLISGLKEFEKLSIITGKDAFNLYQTYGFPLEMTEELAKEKGININKTEFAAELKKHQKLSRTASAGMFKGGLADASEKTTQLHTAAHLMLAALRQVLGTEVFQRGSNITEERLRFDFAHNAKMTPEQIKKIEDLVNEQIQKKLPVVCEEMTLEEAKKQKAMGIFESKYGEQVKVYSIINQNGGLSSVEICGGPHVQNTGELGKFKIKKEESSSAGVRRIKAILE